MPFAPKSKVILFCKMSCVSLTTPPNRFMSLAWLDSLRFRAQRVLRECFLSTRPEKGAPFPAALQCRVDAWSDRSKPLFQLPVLKIRLIYSPHIEDISDIKLIRTDTTLDLSQKAEKR